MHCIFHNVSTLLLSLLFRVQWFSHGGSYLFARPLHDVSLLSPLLKNTDCNSFCSPTSERCQRSTQSRYGIRYTFPRHGGCSHPRVASGQLKHQLMPAQLTTLQWSDDRNTAVAYLSLPFFSHLCDGTRWSLTGSAVGRCEYLWCLRLDTLKSRGSDHLPGQVSCSFPLDLRGDGRLFFFSFLF